MSLLKPESCASGELTSRSATVPQTVELARAISCKNIAKVKTILEAAKGSNLVNCPLGPLGVTPLHLATSTSQSENLVSLLIEEGAQVSATDKIGRSALHYAAGRGDDAVVRLLLSHGADIDSRFEVRSSPHSMPASDSNEKLATHLIPGYQECFLTLPECWGRTPLHQAVRGGHFACVEMLLQNGADVNAEDEKGLTPLLLAGAGGLERYEAIVDLLVFKGADVNRINPNINSFPLYHAVALGSYKATQILLNAGASLSYPFLDSESRSETVLHIAASGGSSAILRLLLKHGADKYLEHCNNVGCTPLHKAAYCGSRDCLQLLIDSGGDLSACTDSGMTVIDIIMSYIPRPINFLTDCLNTRITANGSSINDRDFKVNLDFTILSPHKCSNQMKVVSSLGTTSSLLQHPLVEAFVFAKWAKLKYFFLVIAFIQISFVFSLTIYTMVWIYLKEQEIWFRIVLIFSSSLLFLNSAIELALMGKQRLTKYETWFTLINSLLALIVVLEAGSDFNCKAETTSTEMPCWIRHIASFAILVAWSGVLSLIARFPALGNYASMFGVLLIHFLKVFLTFLCLVVGFALSFSIQFPNDDGAFSNPWQSLVKTIVMMTGEYEYKDLFSSDKSVDMEEPLVPTSRFIFLVFLIVAHFTLMNLTIGLATSDIQGLQTEGNIIRLQKQTDFVSHLERIVAHRFFVNSWLSAAFKCCLPKRFYRHHIPTSYNIQPSSKSVYNILPTPILEALIHVALQNRSKFTDPKDPGSQQSNNIKRFADLSLRKIRGKPMISVSSEESNTSEEIAQLKQLLLETLSAIRQHNNTLQAQTRDMVDNGGSPAEDNNTISVNVNAMLRRVSTSNHPLVHQVFS